MSDHCQWLVAVEGFEPNGFDTRSEAEAEALRQADGTWGLEAAVYRLEAIARAKVSKAKLCAATGGKSGDGKGGKGRK